MFVHMWASKSLELKNPLLQTEHLNGSVPVCLCICRRNVAPVVQRRPHMLHTWSWEFVWLSSDFWHENPLWHFVHGNGGLYRWFRRCLSEVDCFTNFLEHLGHGNEFDRRFPPSFRFRNFFFFVVDCALLSRWSETIWGAFCSVFAIRRGCPSVGVVFFDFSS